MPGNRKLTKKTIKGKEDIHPGSRKASQLTRVQLRSSKLIHENKNRRKAFSAKLNRPVFFMHAITSPYPLTLGSLKVLVQIYIDRDDLRIEELEADRRAGRPKPKELLELETRKSTETKEFETGFEVIDLTHPHTVRLLWNYHETDTYLDTSRLTLLRQIRIFKDSDEIVIHKAGKADTMGFADKGEGEAEDWTEGAGAQSTDVEGSGEMVMDS